METHGENSVVRGDLLHNHTSTHPLIHASTHPLTCVTSSKPLYPFLISPPPPPLAPQHVEALQRADCDRQCYCGTVDSGTLCWWGADCLDLTKITIGPCHSAVLYGVLHEHTETCENVSQRKELEYVKEDAAGIYIYISTSLRLAVLPGGQFGMATNLPRRLNRAVCVGTTSPYLISVVHIAYGAASSNLLNSSRRRNTNA